VRVGGGPWYDPDTSKDGRPALAPGNFMRLLIVGFFDGLDSDRGIAWRTADSMTIRNSSEARSRSTHYHSTLSGIRRRVGRDVYDAMSQQVLEEVAQHRSR
jgi:transposase